MGGDANKRGLLKVCHNSLIASHLGVVKTLTALRKDYWWPRMKDFIQSYVRGCLKCQESKIKTYLNVPLIQPIVPKVDAWLFTTITMDFIIIKLLNSCSYDSILTITNHDCIKVVILLPCWKEIDSLEVTKLYLQRVFPFVGLLKRVILDRDLKGLQENLCIARC